MSAEAYVHVILDSARGQYLPQGFTEKIDRQYVDGISDEDWAALAAGPEHQYYWETWDDVTNNAKVWWDGRGDDKKPYYIFLTENGDGLLVREDIVMDDDLDEWRFKDAKYTLREVIKIAFDKVDGLQFYSKSKREKLDGFLEIVGEHFDLDQTVD